jgi:hypothetical protein
MANKKRICYFRFAMVTLTRADVQPAPPYQVTLRCPYCSREYRLNYSDDYWNKVNSLVKLANKAIREDHKRRHENPLIDLKWNLIWAEY